MRHIPIILLAVITLSACPEPTPAPAPILILVEADMPAQDLPQEMPAPADMPPDMPLGPPRANDMCEVLGLERAPAPDPEVGEGAMGAIARPFEVATDRGPWSLRDRWTGCDTFVFLNHQGDTGQQLWASDVRAMLDRSARNVHYFFSTYDSGLGAFNLTSAMRAKLDAAIAAMPALDAEHWSARVHVLTNPTRALDAGAGDYARASARPLHVFGMRRFGRYGPGGSLA